MSNQKLCINLHHTAMIVEDLREAFHRYEILLGLHGEIIADPETKSPYALMRCMHEDYCLILKEAQGEKPFLDYVAYELETGLSLNEAAKAIQKRGGTTTEIAVPLRGPALLLTDPDGNRVVLVERKKPEDIRPPIMIPTNTLRGYHPRRLGHMNYLTADVKTIHRWYEEILGFKTTDWIEDVAVWMHIDARHHVIAFLEKGPNHVHHTAYDMVDWSEIRHALDHIAKHGRYVTWGPLRHGMAQNLAVYWRMWEEEHFIELCCDMQILDPDHEPIVHPDNPYSSNTWGILPPRSYFEFDAETVQKERDQLHAYVVV